ncbi:hypothetical protein Goklo_013892, partial [Gossypium klotzschianum]|nr:hypothetical protein [Gossypium klotzschianum]
GVISRFWWKRHGGRGGLHWDAWSKLCKSKDSDGLGFRNLAQFNVALLAKQSWRLINYPNSLFARIPGLPERHLRHHGVSQSDLHVSEFINQSTRQWDERLLTDVLGATVANLVLCIPLSQEAHDDILASDSTAILDSYRFVHNKLWKVQLPRKIKITAWRIFNDYIPSYYILYSRPLRPSALCPWCLVSPESRKHICRDCLSIAGVWNDLQITWPVDFIGVSFQDWLLGRILGAECWRPLEGTMLKVNFDATFNVHSMRSCTGLMFRDRLGRGDSLTVIRKACSHLHDISTIRAYIHVVKAMTFRHCLFVHIPRKGNSFAHLLATTGLCGGVCSSLSRVNPNFAYLAVERELPV